LLRPSHLRCRATSAPVRRNSSLTIV
jgi:hypothetical protein